MEGVQIVLTDVDARLRRRSFVAIAATIAAGFMFHVGDGAQAPSLLGTSNGPRPVVTPQQNETASPVPVSTTVGEPRATTRTSQKAAGPLGKFSSASRLEMDRALAVAKRRGPVPSRAQLARYTLAIRTAESGGRYTVAPYRGSTISGAYQASRSTWDNYRGYRLAYRAPKSVQDAWAFRRFITLWQTYNGDWERVTAHHFLPSYADENKALWRKPLPVRFRANNPPTIREYIRRVHVHLI